MAIFTATAIAIASAAVTAGAAVVNYQQSQRAARASRRANRIAGANEQTRNRLARRQAAKKTRLQQAQILQQSENTGVSGSSGQIGAVGSLQNTFAQATAFQSGNTLAAQGISTQNQIGADARSKAQAASDIGSIATSVGNFAQTDAGKDLFN